MRRTPRLMTPRLVVPALLAAALGVGVPMAPAPASASTPPTITVRAATFNVRTARATTDSRGWLQRVPDVARQILADKPGIVMLQELGPGRADGGTGHLDGRLRQTDSLTATLARLGGGRYKLVRATSYVKPGTPHATQGARILYDSSRYRLTSRCPETTGASQWNPSCSLGLPLAAGDSPARRRTAAYSRFADRRTGRQFWVASAHLDTRHSTDNATEARWNRLRSQQAAAVAAAVAAHNPQHLPVFFGGDLNSWQTDRGHYAPHRTLTGDGYADAVGARTRINWRYPTITRFRTTVPRTRSRYGGSRLDVVMVQRAKSFSRWENVMDNPDRTRPSDHNMVLADVRI